MINKRALITGGKGFVGKYFHAHLLNLGNWDVEVVDVKGGGQNCIDFFRTDERRWDLVIHLAALVGGRETIDGAPLSVAYDMVIDGEFFNWAIRTSQLRVVYYSSSAAYPTALQKKAYKLKESDIDLSDCRMPDQTYGWAKLTGERLAELARAEGLNVHVFRPFSGYGWDQDGAYPYPMYIRRARRRMDPFDIWGDGTQVRDFIHMSDVVQATMKAVEEDIQYPVNLGSGRPTSFLNLAEMVSKQVGYTPEINLLKDKPVGVQYRVADTKLMSQFYTPKISLEQAIATDLST